MNFQLTEEQAQFREVMRDFVEKEILPVAHDYEQAGTYPSEIVETMKQLGLFGMTVPSEFGGVGTDAVSFAIAFEEISRGWMGVAGVIGSHSLACWMVNRHGTDEQRQRYLPDLASGQRRTGIALTEPGAGTDLQGISTVARKVDGNYLVRGTKTWITNARHADPLPVLVKTDPAAKPAHRGMSVLLIDGGSDGLSVSRDLGKLGYKGPETCEVVLDDVRVPEANLLGGVEGQGLQQALSALQSGRINVAARAVGVAQAAYEAALVYAKERTAFGQPIAQFQAIQLKLADLATKVQAARLMTFWAADCLDRDDRPEVAAGMAKVFASEVALEASLESMRVHGAYGYSTEYDVERYYRDAPLMAIGEGTNDILRTVIAKRLLEDR